jgi:hypothetical protein
MTGHGGERILSTRVDLFLYQLNISGLTVSAALIAWFSRLREADEAMYRAKARYDRGRK